MQSHRLPRGKRKDKKNGRFFKTETEHMDRECDKKFAQQLVTM